MKILVTGANGYLGQGITKKLIYMGHDVVATGKNLDHVDEAATKIACDLFTVNDPFPFFHKPDVLLHLAWHDGFIHNSEKHIKELPKHFDFLKKMFESDIKRIAVMGTMHEVGFYEGSISEDTPCFPLNLYGISKNALRNCVQLLSKKYNINYQWLRAFYIVGNSQFGSSIFSKITNSEKEGKNIFPFTTGKNQYDFLDYEEFCYQVAAAVGQNNVNGIINVCSGLPESLASRVEKFISQNHYKIRLKYGAFPERSYDSKAVWGDNAKIERILNNYRALNKKAIR